MGLWGSLKKGFKKVTGGVVGKLSCGIVGCKNAAKLLDAKFAGGRLSESGLIDAAFAEEVRDVQRRFPGISESRAIAIAGQERSLGKGGPLGGSGTLALVGLAAVALLLILRR